MSAPVCESFVTFTTLMRSFPRLSPHLIYRMVNSCETHITFIVFIWFLTGVSFNVKSKFPNLIEILATLAAFIGFLPCMNPHMDYKMGL